jgi:TrmH family RNA methyltransferase
MGKLKPMKEISSRSNPLWRDWMHQRSVAGRPGNLIWLDGEHLCHAWLAKRGQPLWAIFDQSKIESPHFSKFRDQIDPTRQVLMSSALFDQLVTVKSAQGMLFLVDHAMTLSSPAQALSHAELGSNSSAPDVVEFERAVMLDSIQDPGNLGTILRLSAAFGVSHIILGPGCAAVWSPKVLRSAQGAHFALTLIEVDDLVLWLNAYRQAVTDSAVVLATAVVDAQSLGSVKLPQRSIWLFGHEGQGVSPQLLKMADVKVNISHDQTVVDSLNVASAAAICLFEQSRQNSL